MKMKSLLSLLDLLRYLLWILHLGLDLCHNNNNSSNYNNNSSNYDNNQNRNSFLVHFLPNEEAEEEEVVLEEEEEDFLAALNLAMALQLNVLVDLVSVHLLHLTKSRGNHRQSRLDHFRSVEVVGLMKLQTQFQIH